MPVDLQTGLSQLGETRRTSTAQVANPPNCELRDGGGFKPLSLGWFVTQHMILRQMHKVLMRKAKMHLPSSAPVVG